ncbi:Type II secretory pathway ATPase GspE/PulE or T4P pilus assembly pathway ATPase PilB [Malonomonas rubra DSM 5091]|uniref:Type II secretory pathway ATPase GspE/PulE or T4P pilus assembly pathway ATPase PilB n=1 Tax=Malonomonas rubra DSM 5091 TaxID=1122189 RepID=A0A1M6L7C8_MALRU|nr:ATPase, T2SS/T4P/T4SS family [Malonomonas rubra]SHJ67092.1 Type II secretory pathway ATPase GspE/PulE or T4P pilus assembly pathway ATPase PilB [Malonomonas rubra DSM 5091]
MKHPLIIKFLTGREEQVNLLRPFHPRDSLLHVELIRSPGEIEIALADLCYIMVLDNSGWQLPAKEGELVEHIETTTGDSFNLRVPAQNHKSGFYAFPVDQNASYRNIFFTFSGIRQRREERPLSDILEERGWLQENVIHEVLDEQEKLRHQKVGEILAEKANLPADKIEELAVQVSDARETHNIRIGDLLIQAGLISRNEVEEAIEKQSSGKRKRVGELLIEKGLISEEQLLVALSAKFRMPVVDLGTITPSSNALDKLSKNIVTQLKVFPISLENRCLTVATSDPTDASIGDNLRFFTNLSIEFVVAPATEIREATEKYYGETGEENDGQIADLLGELSNEQVDVEEDGDDGIDSSVSETDSQIITLVNHILLDGFRKGASDIHFEPGLGNLPLQVRYRIDGICNVAHQIASSHKRAMISRIKIIAKLDIAERRKPQSGKIVIRSDRRKIEYRVETTPTAGGQEDAVLRILSSSQPLNIRQLGFSDNNYRNFAEILSKPYGIILCVGPTGSGKTTTLHSALSELNTAERKIWTAEDPIEITQPGLRQVQVNAKIGFTFDQALRSFLRADPDIIMIGEMRDPETAKTAIEASLTGHLVFSTLHTNTAPETVVRLIEMGMDPYNFANALLGVLAQRLARHLCKQCREAYQPSSDELEKLQHYYGKEYYLQHGLPTDPQELTLYRAKGCDDCNKTGYRGRVAIHELLTTSDSLRRAIKENVLLEDLRTQAIDDGMHTLMMDGIKKVLGGHTDLEQILRVCM